MNNDWKYSTKKIKRRTLYGRIVGRPHDEYRPFLFDLGGGDGLCYRKCGRVMENVDSLDIIWIKKIAKET